MFSNKSYHSGLLSPTPVSELVAVTSIAKVSATATISCTETTTEAAPHVEAAAPTKVVYEVTTYFVKATEITLPT